MRKNGGNALALLVIFIVAVAIVAYVFVSRISPSQPSVIVDVKVDPTTFKISESTKLEIQLKNQDSDKVHTVSLGFVTNPLVHIFLGQNELPTEEPNSANYTYLLLLQPGQATTQPFVMKVPALPIGILNQDFYVIVSISIDGILQNSLEKKVTFTAES